MSICCCLGFSRCLRSLETICSLACCARLLLVMFFASAILVLGALSEFSCTSKNCLLCSSSQVIHLGDNVHVCLACASLTLGLLRCSSLLLARTSCLQMRSDNKSAVQTLQLQVSLVITVRCCQAGTLPSSCAYRWFLIFCSRSLAGFFFLQKRIRATRSLCASSQFARVFDVRVQLSFLLSARAS